MVGKDQFKQQNEINNQLNDRAVEGKANRTKMKDTTLQSEKMRYDHADDIYE